MEAILQAVQSGVLNAEIAVVGSNNPEAPALEIAKQFGARTFAVSHKGKTREKHEELISQEILAHGADYVALAGYMRVLTGHFLSRFANPDGNFRVINIHPSLLPAFPGASGYEDAFNYGVRVSGITVHLVDEKVDHGPILAQETFPRLDDDTLETFKARGLALEHKLYSKVLQDIVERGIVILDSHRHAPMPEAVSSTAAGRAHE